MRRVLAIVGAVVLAAALSSPALASPRPLSFANPNGGGGGAGKHRPPVERLARVGPGALLRRSLGVVPQSLAFDAAATLFAVASTHQPMM